MTSFNYTSCFGAERTMATKFRSEIILEGNPTTAIAATFLCVNFSASKGE